MIIELTETDNVPPIHVIKAEATGWSPDGEATRTTTEVSSVTEPATKTVCKLGKVLVIDQEVPAQ